MPERLSAVVAAMSEDYDPPPPPAFARTPKYVEVDVEAELADRPDDTPPSAPHPSRPPFAVETPDWAAEEAERRRRLAEVEPAD
jgi:hypothetical protein